MNEAVVKATIAFMQTLEGPSKSQAFGLAVCLSCEHSIWSQICSSNRQVRFHSFIMGQEQQWTR